MSGPPKVKPAGRKRHPTASQPGLENWSLEDLQNNPTPWKQAFGRLIGLGARSALFLASSENTGGQVQPITGQTYQSSAAFSAGAREALWSGLRWEPGVTPQFSTQFSRTGFLEVAPQGVAGSPAIKEDGMLIRNVFGALSDEFVLVLRVGSIKNPEGVLIAFAGQSLLSSMPELVSEFTLPVRKKAA